MSDGEWPIVALGELIESIEAGSSFRCRETPPEGHEVGVAKVSAVSWGRYQEDESKTCLDPNRIDENLLIRQGDFLISRANTVELVGACVIAERVSKKVMLSDKTLRIQFKDPSLKPWVLHFLRSRAGRRQIEALCTGNQESMRNISQRSIRQIQLPLAPAQERAEILSFVEQQLSCVEATTITLQAVQAKIKQARASILKAAVEGRLVETEAELAQRKSSYFEDGNELLRRSLAEREVEYNAESSKQQRSKRYRLPASPNQQSVDASKLPPGWALGSIEQISSGLRYSLCIGPFGSNLKVSDYCEQGVPLIFVRNIRAESFSLEEATFVTHEKAAVLSAHKARPGDILITKMGDPPGDSAIYPENFPEAVITADVIKLHVASTYSLRFILYSLRSPLLRRQILSQTKGVAQKKVSLERFAKISIPIPPYSEQERIADEVEHRFSVLYQVEATVNASIRRCGQLRQAVLKRAFWR